MKTPDRGLLFYNDDSCSLREQTPPHNVTQITAAVDYLFANGVDRLCWCLYVNNVAIAYHSDIVENFTDLARQDEKRGMAYLERNLIASLEEQGIDYLPLLIAETRKRGMEFYVSLRMNDAHAKSHPQGSLVSAFWKENPQWRLWGVTDGLSYYNAAMDYAVPEVRERFFSVVREIVSRYEVDGLEFDFGRNPYLFQPGMAWESRNLMTGLLREIRALLDAQPNGRKIGMMARLPSRRSEREYGGIDLPGFLEAGLLNAVVGCSTANDYTLDLTREIELCRQYHVPFLGSIEITPLCNKRPVTVLTYEQKAPKHSYAYMPSVNELCQSTMAMAETFLAQGAQGVYLFNFACRLFECGGKFSRFTGTEQEKLQLKNSLHFCVEPTTLAQVPRLYFFWTQLPLYAEALRPAEFHQTLQFPLYTALSNQERVTVSFRCYHTDNPHSGVPRQELPLCGLLECKINGQRFVPTRVTREPVGLIPSGYAIGEHELWQGEISAMWLRYGENDLTFFMPGTPCEEIGYVYIYDFRLLRE